MKVSTGEWNDVLFSSLMRVGSVCMRVMDVHVYGIGLVSVIFRSVFAHDTQASPQASWCGGPSVTTLVFLQGKENVARTIAQVLKPVLLSFLDRMVMCFFSRMTHIYIRLLRRSVLLVMHYNCPGQKELQISRQLNTYAT